MDDLAAFKARVELVLAEFIEREAEQLTAVSESLAPFVAQLRESVGTGKRLRAAYCYWGWRASGQPDCDGAVKAAAAMELVHAAAMVHDDIIDSSDTRHGAPTAHVALGALVADRGGPVPGGVALALLLGNQLIAWSAQLFADCGLPAAFVSRTRPLWATLARELIAGEYLEVVSTGRPTEAARSLQIILFKTAKYTVERPLHLGGTLAGASKGTLAAFSDYGIPLGEAFQLRDDLLGVFGDPRETGKSNLDDLTGAKPTVLLALARSSASARQQSTLDRLVGRRNLSRAQARTVRSIMEGTGARAQVEQMAQERVARALAALGRAGFGPEASGALRSLALTALNRTS